MRSALAGTASNVVALKTTAAVPMSVIERMFHLLCGAGQQQSRVTLKFPETIFYLKNIFEAPPGTTSTSTKTENQMSTRRFPPPWGGLAL
jgi:hypothetical protein